MLAVLLYSSTQYPIWIPVSSTGMTPTHAHFVIPACDQKKHRPQVSAT
ncbi:MAG: hypothetical protein ACEY3L_11570 [Wolbachia sp.]